MAWVAVSAIALSARVALADVVLRQPSGVTADGSVPATSVPTTPAVPLAPPAGTLPGIDVSHYQGTIDWAAVAGSGIRFAIAKATDGENYVDPTYLTNKVGAYLNGITFGAYHFARPGPAEGDAVAEADHYVENAALEPGNLIPVLDVERTGNLSQDELVAWILAWLGRVTERTGVRPMIYTSPNGWLQRTGDSTAIADAGYTTLWVAHWDTDSPRVPASDWAGNGWTFWQYDNCGSIPGIEGCVDVDAFAGSDFTGVTLPSPDVTPPTAALSTPVGGPATIAFDEIVRHVTPDNTYVWTPQTGTYPAMDLECRSGGDVVVDCATGKVRTVLADTVDPLIPGELYEAIVNPELVTSAVVDRGGNPVPTTTSDFPAATSVEETDRAVVASWRQVSKGSALGGSYVVERSAGARASFAFTGGSVTWYTASGPTMGRATVSIDGEPVGTFDGYASRSAFAVPHRFTGLALGDHVLTIRALGRGSARATDTQVVVDAFGVRGTITKTPRLTATWSLGNGLARSDEARASVTVTFHGTGIDWVSERAPDQGRAQVFVDGVLDRTVDGYGTSIEPDVVRSVTGLAPGTHTIRIIVLGEGRRAATGTFVSVDRFDVRP